MKIKGRTLKLQGVQILALGFIAVILIGAIILSLPISSASGESTRFLDSLFTSTSAVCVTGLVVVDTGTHWNMLGQVIIMLLIEIGGLGFMSFTTLIAILLGKKITLRERLVMQEAMNTFSIQGLVKMVKYILIFTLSVQLGGALLLSTQFIPDYGIAKGIFVSIFHSVSAFCNAGFDIIGNFNSLVPYNNNPVVILVISALLIIGGIGFAVWLEIYNYKKGNKVSLHSKVVLLVTGILIIGGTLLMLIFEYNNPATLGPMSFGDKLLNGFFAAATPRTAGFNSISVGEMTTSGIFLTIIFMFIGGSPGSTAGGLKTSTFGVVIITVISVIRGREDAEVFGKRLSKDLVYRAFAVFIIAISVVISVTMVLSYTEVGMEFKQLLFEVSSAFGTAGLSTGITTELSTIGRIVIIITMYIGRVGPLTVVLALASRRRNKGYKYPEGKILIG